MQVYAPLWVSLGWVCSSSGFIGLGLIIRDSLGFPLAIGAVRLRASFDPQSAEAAAILCGIGLARNCTFAPVHMESGSLNVINFLRNGFIPLSDVGSIVSNILCPDFISSVLNFSFVPRTANKVADTLAKATLGFEFDSFLLEFCPPFVDGLIQDDRPD
ncbi:hypothetical protein ACOSP7_012601 [Xanthoceras sorbifolium]